MNADTTNMAPTEAGPEPELPDLPPLNRVPILTHLGAALSLIIAGVTMIGFGIGWGYLFYPPMSLALAGAITCFAFAVAAFGAAIHAFVEAGHWVRRRA